MCMLVEMTGTAVRRRTMARRSRSVLPKAERAGEAGIPTKPKPETRTKPSGKMGETRNPGAAEKRNPKPKPGRNPAPGRTPRGVAGLAPRPFTLGEETGSHGVVYAVYAKSSLDLCLP